MQRSTVFVTVLLSLFMFQSFWNVAAAFCAHETVREYSMLNHFGHHVAEKAHSSEQGTVFDNVAADLPMPLSLQDHHDHLPSCFHVVVAEVQQRVNAPMLHSQDVEQKYYWSNSYQSPHLTGLNPPPVLTPL